MHTTGASRPILLFLLRPVDIFPLTAGLLGVEMPAKPGSAQGAQPRGQNPRLSATWCKAATNRTKAAKITKVPTLQLSAVEVVCKLRSETQEALG